jgi:Domain of unknown function (DUF4276)
MQGRMIFLVEEPSMKVLLDGLLPRLFPGWQEKIHFMCVAHEGKSDLDKSVPRKLKEWRIPGDRFIIVRDNDNADCSAVKARYVAMCSSSGRPESLVRLVCQELESWYLGDLWAMGQAFNQPDLMTPNRRKRFKETDSWEKPSIEVERMVADFGKVAGARVMSAHLRDVAQNRSPSYKVFVTGVQRVAAEMGWAMNTKAANSI